VCESVCARKSTRVKESAGEEREQRSWAQDATQHGWLPAEARSSFISNVFHEVFRVHHRQPTGYSLAAFPSRGHHECQFFLYVMRSPAVCMIAPAHSSGQDTRKCATMQVHSRLSHPTPNYKKIKNHAIPGLYPAPTGTYNFHVREAAPKRGDQRVRGR
jgi:hypothetical protein